MKLTDEELSTKKVRESVRKLFIYSKGKSGAQSAQVVNNLSILLRSLER